MQEYRKINFGACADIFEMPGGRVLKAYRRTAYATKPVHDWEDHDLVTEAYFRAEALAYERLQSMAELIRYTPEYFGRADPIELLPIKSASEQFVEGCGLILEFIPGKAIKLNRLKRTTRLKVGLIAAKLNRSLRNVNVWDASCFFPGVRSEFTLIDFALWELQEYTSYLFEHPKLSKQLREKLVRENT